ncbi:hypothetical protein BRADI_4g18931v3 [Brachypodium distachyon]|uniref:Uncharacterized protein n=1 Tax=Brachypodium distachyon TaxID=15368 RepID=A0A0Q3EQ95_BRADI|nr:hypothetical protein BRADI_4g18931v3 [Brachypodium distachyon]
MHWLGWDQATRTVTADEDWWQETIKGNKLAEGFRKGPPGFIDELEIMFAGAHVDGKSSYMPGAGNEQVIIEDDN